MKGASIFKQLILKAIIPVVVVLVGLAIYNIKHTKALLVKSSNDKNELLSQEIQNELAFQDFALSLIEEGLNKRINYLGHSLTDEYFAETSSIIEADLIKIQEELGMNPDLEDIYIINEKGVIVNTTFKRDLNFDLFSLGLDLKEYLLSIFVHGKPKIDAFSIENKTNKFKKYAYYPTKDGKYIIELGVYSSKASSVVNLIKNRINEISEKQESINAVDLFIGEDNPISFNKDAKISEEHREVFLNTMNTKRDYSIDEKTKEKHLKYDFIYLGRKNSDLYGNAVIRIITDRSKDDDVISAEVRFFAIIFVVTFLALFIVILLTTKTITDPIKQLVESVNRISEGNFTERTSAGGSQEISKLSNQFNKMLDKIEGFYNELEKKVLERTAEISQQKEEIEAQRDHIEEQRDRMTDSIHYAKRIQTAVLPTPTSMQNYLGEFFVMYRPKDIVSGDFYWSHKVGNKVIVVAADCTGHGVPGAFMALIGNTLLNKIVKENQIVDPGVILTEMSKEIIASLKQTGEHGDSKDGMDITICVIDYDTNKMDFAGANNPLYHVRDGELTVTKGDKQPVGYFIGDSKAFNTKTFDLIKGDMVYLFSDGYQDQFGGELNKKFMVGRYKRLLKEISNQPLIDQKQILDNTIDDWMINTKQIDDILIIGIRI